MLMFKIKSDIRLVSDRFVIDRFWGVFCFVVNIFYFLICFVTICFVGDKF